MVPAPSSNPHPVFATHEAHELELRVQHALAEHPSVEFGTLAIHRIPGGVCLEGSIIRNTLGINVSEVVRAIDGITEVANRLVDCSQVGCSPDHSGDYV